MLDVIFGSIETAEQLKANNVSIKCTSNQVLFIANTSELCIAVKTA